MNSIFTVSDWVISDSYFKHEIVKVNDLYYYALQDIPTNTAFSTDYFGGYLSVGTETKPHFIWKPSYNSPADHAPKVNTIQFGDGYEQRVANGINNSLISFNLSFDLRTLQEAAAIVHFLHVRQGVESFFFTPPAPYAETKKFICKEWSHNPNFFNNHSIRARFEERIN